MQLIGLVIAIVAVTWLSALRAGNYELDRVASSIFAGGLTFWFYATALKWWRHA